MVDGAVVLRIVTLLVVLAGAAFPLRRGVEPQVHLQDFQSSSPLRIHQQQRASGLAVGVPEKQVRGYAPLPCTPDLTRG